MVRSVTESGSFDFLPEALADLDSLHDRDAQSELQQRLRSGEKRLWEWAVDVLGTFGNEGDITLPTHLTTPGEIIDVNGQRAEIWLRENPQPGSIDPYPQRTESISVRARTIGGQRKGPERELFCVSMEGASNWLGARPSLEQLEIASRSVAAISDLLSVRYRHRIYFPRR